MIKRVVLFLLILVFAGHLAKAQTSKEFYESIIKNTDYTHKSPIEVPYVDPSDVLWAKTIWREVVLREKMNLPLYYPTTPVDGRMSLIDLMLDGIKNSGKGAYDDDDLQIPLTYEEIKNKFDGQDDSLTRLNPETGMRETVVITGEMNTSEVKRLLIKELWYFNKKSSRMEVRIIALCPVREYVREEAYDGVLKSRLFWIDYGEFRDIFARQKVFNFENDAVHLSFDDLFLKRYFSSRVYQESNVYNNRPISSYASGMDVMLESDRIKNEIFTLEQDLWEY